MPIWVDADACPKVIKEILYRAATRSQVRTTFVANQALTLPRSPYLIALQVPKGFDVADHEIVRRVVPRDLVVTSDIPLAADVVCKGAEAVSPRGEQFNKESVAAALTMRNFMDTLRSSGVETGGPPALSQADRSAFAKVLEAWLAVAPRAGASDTPG